MRWTLLAAVVAALASLAVGSRDERAPRFQVVDGTLSLQNSRDGQAILSAEGIAPGQSAGGTVTVSNTGTLAGDLALSQSDPDGAGALAQQLQLRVEDVTAAPAATVYSGPLQGLDALALGTLAPGAARVYGFTASLPAGADNSAAGAEVSVAYTWTATEAAAPPDPPDAPDPPAPPPPGGGAPPDSTSSLRKPLRLTLRVPAGQLVAAHGRLIAYVRCSEACTIAGRARFGPSAGRAVPSRRGRLARVRAGRRTRLVLRLSTRARRILDRRTRASASVTVTGRSRDGGRRTVRKRVRIGASRARR